MFCYAEKSMIINRKDSYGRGRLMKFKINNKYFRWGLTAFLVIVAGTLFYYLVFHAAQIKAGADRIADILMPVVCGAAIAYLLTPVLNFTEKRFLLPLCKRLGLRESRRRNALVRCIGIIITTCLFLALICFLMYMLLSQIVPSVQNIITQFDSYSNNFVKWLNRVLEDNPELGKTLIKMVNSYTDDLEKWLNELLPNTAQLIKTVSLSVISALGILWDFVIGFIISIYVLASKERFAGQAKKVTYALFEKDTANTVIRNFRFTHRMFIGFFSGKILDSAIVGIVCFIGTSFLHTPYAALVSVVVGVTNVIPFFGPYLGAIPSAILIFIVEPTQPQNCLYFVIFILILQQIDGNILGPKILGNSTGLSGFWVIFAITLFGGLFGIVGMIIGVPVFAVLYAAVRSLLNTTLEKKSLPVATERYEQIDFVDEQGIHDRPQESSDSAGKRSIKATGHHGWSFKRKTSSKNEAKTKEQK